MKNLIFKIFGFLIAFSMLMISCKEEEITLNGARLSPKAIVIYEDATPQKVYLYLYPTKATKIGLRWETTDNNIITVSNDGMVSPVGPGSAYVVIYQGVRTLDSCFVTVNPVIHVTGITISPETLDLTVGSSSTLTVNILPEDATYTGVQWTSSDETVATVSSGGVVKGVSVGEAVITATTNDGGLTAQCTVTVEEGAPSSNLLVNPGFEDPADATTTLPSPWVVMTAADLTVDYPQGPAYIASNRTDNTFWTTGAGGTGGFGPYEGNYCGRLPAGNSSGLYQLVDVVPGTTYNFSAWVIHFRTSTANQSVIKVEQFRIKNEDGSVTLESVDVGTLENTWMQVTGSVTIPDGVNKIRFQISQHDEAVPMKAPGTLIDDCEFIEQ